MGDVRVRNVDDEIIKAWKDRAQRQGHSLQVELHGYLTEKAMRPRRELASRLRAFHQGVVAVQGELPDSTAIIREERDVRG